ncbi:MAG: hypothetical protein RL326_240 [Pseudomonadota bacterium]|jgi:hypothetical protein
MTSKPQYSVGSLIQHAHLGTGRIVGYSGEFYVIHFKGDVRNVPFSYQEMKPLETTDDPELQRVKLAVREVLGDFGWVESDLEVSKRWLGGTVRLIPGKDDTQPKDIPIENFIKKVIGVREKLRVLEQKINNHAVLDAADKVELQGYITRCYGSLTTFNALFSDKVSHFVGSGSGE